MDRLKTDNLTLSYNGKDIIVSRLKLHIPDKQITALVGPNGCGKSTILRGLSRLLKPKHGTVYLSGQSIHAMKAKTLARALGILPQSPTAPEGLTVHELVAQGRYPHQSWFQQWSHTDEQITQDALRVTNLLELADRPVDTLSGGQRQRAWIAMALAQQTDMLLLDEPTTFLDLAYQIEILDLLIDLNAEGRTIVMVLHDLNQAARYADRMVAIHAGQIAAQGTPDDVLTENNLREIFRLESQIVRDPVAGTPMCVPISNRRQRIERPAETARSNGHIPDTVNVTS